MPQYALCHYPILFSSRRRQNVQFACISVKRCLQIQKLLVHACESEVHSLVYLFISLSSQCTSCLEQVSFKRIPFIISRTPGHPVLFPRGHSLQMSNAPFQQGISICRRPFQTMAVNSFRATSPSRSVAAFPICINLPGRDCKTQVLNPY